MKFILNLKFVFVLDENERGIGDNFKMLDNKLRIW